MTVSYKRAQEILNEFVGIVEDAQPFSIAEYALVGSTAIVGVGQDVDVLMLAIGGDCRAVVEQHLLSLGFVIEGEEGEYPIGDFNSMRHPENPELNALITHNEQFFESWKRAVDVCRYVHEEFGECDKQTRVEIHRLIMD